MLTEQFINLCGSIVFQTHNKFTSSVYSDIYHILHHYKEDSIPLDSRKKFKLVQTLTKLKIADKAPDEIFDYVAATGQFNDLKDYLTTLSTRIIPEEKIDSAIRNIVDRKKFSAILKDTPVLEDFIKKINNNSFSDLGEPIKQWEGLVSQISTKISEEKRKESYVNITSLDLAEDPYEEVLNQIERNYNGKNSITTGYNQLDGYMNGGFEPTRLYIFAGASGDGKSILLMNFLKNAVQRRRENVTEKEIYIYFTLENLVDESLTRLYCSLQEKEYKEMMRSYSTIKPTIERTVKEWQIGHNTVVNMAYFPATLTSVSDLLNYVEKVKNRYAGRGTVKAIYIDYLDLLKSGQTFDLYRLEQGQVTIDLKVAAVINRIPIISATQLNRGGYDQKAALSLTQMSESMKKVEHSDFIGILRTITDEMEEGQASLIPSPYGKMQVVIGKNRSGPKNKEVQFVTNFSKFLISERSRDEVPMMELPQQLPFQV